MLSALGLTNPAQAATPARVPPWPSVTASVPVALLQPATTTTDAYLQVLQQRLERRVRAAGLGSDVSVQVADLATGDVVYGYRARNPQIPASSQKTATALAALSAAGAETRLPTTVLRSADGRAITLVGGGDPLLGSTDLATLAQRVARKLAAAGSAADRVQVRFDDTRFAPATTPEGWYSSYFSGYAARPSALSRDLRHVADPGLDAAAFFRAKLKQYGQRVSATVTRTAAGSDATKLARLRGHTIGEAVWPMLQYSDNSIAENLIRHVALARGADTTAGAAAAAVADELRGLGIGLGNTRFVDGSGLSAVNRETAASLVAITRAAVDPSQPELGVGFRTSAYPLAGRSGTLASRYDSAMTRCAAGRVMAKTGTLNRAVALSGIASSTDGRLRAFAVLVNDFPASTDRTRELVDRIATAVTGCR